MSGRGRQVGHVLGGVTTAPAQMTHALHLATATFPALCAKGHRVIPSFGICYDVEELREEPDSIRVFRYVYLPDCEG